MKFPVLLKFSMSEAPFELMYRRPGKRRHENITDVLDDILIRLEQLEDAVDKLYEQDDHPGLTD